MAASDVSPRQKGAKGSPAPTAHGCVRDHNAGLDSLAHLLAVAERDK